MGQLVIIVADPTERLLDRVRGAEFLCSLFFCERLQNLIQHQLPKFENTSNPGLEIMESKNP